MTFMELSRILSVSSEILDPESGLVFEKPLSKHRGGFLRTEDPYLELAIKMKSLIVKSSLANSSRGLYQKKNKASHFVQNADLSLFVLSSAMLKLLAVPSPGFEPCTDSSQEDHEMNWGKYR